MPNPAPAGLVVADGGGKLLTEGFVGTLLAKALLEGFGFIQLIQLAPGPVLWHPVDNKQGKHTTPALIQTRHLKKTRMANSSFLEQVGGFSHGGIVVRDCLCREFGYPRHCGKYDCSDFSSYSTYSAAAARTAQQNRNVSLIFADLQNRREG